jgi:DNA-binding NtrC family response regulator
MSRKRVEKEDPSPGQGPPDSGRPYQPRVLIAEDDARTGGQLRDLLESALNLEVDIAHDGKQALDALRDHFYSVFLTDLKMPRIDGMRLIREITQEHIPVTVIVMTGHGSIDQAVEAIHAGAYDFLAKPLDLDRLQLVIERALNERALRDEVVYLREQLGARAFSEVLTKSPRMLTLLELVQNIAHTTTTVLIEGETGTGKEVLARAIHRASEARQGPMVAVNCAALPENLLESELFGHEKGAFTGAVSQRTGRFEQADEGTLFLDEVGEIPPAMQVKLLRVLQDRKFERVGGNKPIEVDVRVIAATNRSLARMVKKGRFREDLYYRINVVRMELPPLRDRPMDIPLLAGHFCIKFSPPGKPKEISPAAMEVLLNHHWPGNVRELENAIERACVTCTGPAIGPENLPPELTQPAKRRSPFRIDLNTPLPELLKEIAADVEARYIRKALGKAHGNVGKCADLCGLSRRSITAKIAEYGINKEELKER